jgi:hypothetical protein
MFLETLLFRYQISPPGRCRHFRKEPGAIDKTAAGKRPLVSRYFGSRKKTPDTRRDPGAYKLKNDYRNAHPSENLKAAALRKMEKSQAKAV